MTPGCHEVEGTPAAPNINENITFWNKFTPFCKTWFFQLHISNDGAQLLLAINPVQAPSASRLLKTLSREPFFLSTGTLPSSRVWKN